MFGSNTLVSEVIKVPSWLRSICTVVLSSLLISLFAKVSIPLPFTPVPIATQGAVILLLSAFLGPRKAVGAVMGFLGQAACGLPVLAGGTGGIAVFMGPTGGYLLGYLLAAFVVGYLFEKMGSRTTFKVFLALFAGNAVIFFFGVTYLSTFVGFQKALALGFVPFIVGDLLKLTLSVNLLRFARR